MSSPTPTPPGPEGPALTHIAALPTYFADATPNAPALIEGDAALDWRAFKQRSDALAARLVARGVTPGDRVALLAEPSIGYAVTLFACARIGAIYVGLNPRHTAEELRHVLDTTAPRVTLCRIDADDRDRVSRLDAAGCAQPLPFAAAGPLDGLPETGAPAVATADDPGAAAAIVFTSGTTGRPKGATLAHRGLVQGAMIQSRGLGLVAPRYLNNLPANHVGCLVNLTLAPLLTGGCIVFQPRFDAAEVPRLIARHGITAWLQVPTMFTLVLGPGHEAGHDLSSLDAVAVGGGPLGPELLARLRRLAPQVHVEYGQTELMSTVSFAPRGVSDEVLTATAGMPAPEIELRISGGGEGGVLGPGETGEIQARGTACMSGYWGDDAATRAAFTDDGWLRTGDLGQLRADGNLVIVGRLSEMIKSGGYNVYPREVEQALEALSEVAEAAVFGRPHPVYVEAVHAAVTATAPVEPERLRKLLKGTLANYKIPRTIQVMDALPRLPNGKIDRRLLAAADGAAATDQLA